MARYRRFRILPIILAIIIIVIVVVAIISIVQVITGNNNRAANQVDTSRQTLLDTTSGHSVVATVRGPIVADENFHSYTITIAPDQRTMATYTGYQNTVVDSTTLPNSTAAYSQFVNALDRANLANGTQLTGEANNLLGRCATGMVYDFQIMNGDKVAKDLWTSTCSGSQGSLSANLTQVLNLFKVQIPNASSLIQQIGLQ